MEKFMGKIFWLGLCVLLALGCAEESEPVEEEEYVYDSEGSEQLQ